MDQAVNIQHKNLSSGKWGALTFLEQMANIGSEVSRALNWQKKGKKDYSLKAACRSLELIDLSLEGLQSFPKLKELARVREAIVDYFYGTNTFASSEILWRRYFDHFHYAARKDY